jgi:serine/threonine-protein kinase ATR
VDFDCLFDKGLTLAVPELTPFRLTPNMIDALGVTGAEGVFRRACELTLQELREKRDTLMGVLESFIHDPLVEWKGSRRGSGGARRERGARDDAAAATRREGERRLARISDRLRGIYNLRVSGPSSRGRRDPGVPRGEAGAADGALPDALELSVQGQVTKLIKEATDDRNLCRMWIGWMPFL